MCGRYALDQNARALTDHFGLLELPDIAPRYNIAPATLVLAVRRTERGRIGELMRWGLEPGWTRAPGRTRFVAKPINARAETLQDRPMFRGAFRARRCILPASGFYEWRRTPAGTKQPFYVRPTQGPVFALAGLYESGDAQTPATCCIVTTAANAAMATIHDRMPVILGRDDFAAWLDARTPEATLVALLAPCPSGWLQALPVGPRVNSVRNDDPSLIQALPGSD